MSKNKERVVKVFSPQLAVFNFCQEVVRDNSDNAAILSKGVRESQRNFEESKPKSCDTHFRYFLFRIIIEMSSLIFASPLNRSTE